MGTAAGDRERLCQWGGQGASPKGASTATSEGVTPYPSSCPRTTRYLQESSLLQHVHDHWGDG